MLKSLEIPKIKLNGLLSGKTDVPAVKKGSVSVSAILRHISVLLYAVPVEAAARLIPADFEPAETLVGGRRVAWLSVVSFLDEGSRLDGQGAFEQTDYRLHVIKDGRPAQWLIGTSLGSLAAVGMRNLWPMPWRLSAMEFQVSYDSSRGRYANYHLHTQSQWENAVWEISDSGEAFLDAESDLFPASLFAESVTTYFERRDGSTGSFRTRNSGSAFTKARLRKGGSEMLARLGLLSRQDAGNPVLALTQHSLTCQHYSPTIIGSPARPSTEAPGRLPEYARAS
ncbi:MAG: DUF2071 domain-containing protein [Acidobacteriota bacterium]|nr:MAG: DUF2071 domain-containing protein [Acidobacteriota bacterium]